MTTPTPRLHESSRKGSHQLPDHDLVAKSRVMDHLRAKRLPTELILQILRPFESRTYNNGGPAGLYPKMTRSLTDNQVYTPLDGRGGNTWGWQPLSNRRQEFVRPNMLLLRGGRIWAIAILLELEVSEDMEVWDHEVDAWLTVNDEKKFELVSEGEWRGVMSREWWFRRDEEGWVGELKAWDKVGVGLADGRAGGLFRVRASSITLYTF